MNKLNRDIQENEIIVLEKELHNEEYQDFKFLLFRLKSGFGMLQSTMGTALFGEYVSDGEQCRIDPNYIDVLETEKFQAKYGKFGEKYV